jgi:homoaconitase/3-isopropylmalate dehydratase large subunit
MAMEVRLMGRPGKGVMPKDIALALIGAIGKLCGGGGLGFYQGLYIRYNSARWRANSRCSFNR